MNIFELEKISLKMEALDNLLLAMEIAIFSNDFDVSSYRVGFAYLTNMAIEISSELKRIVEGEFENGKQINSK